MNKKQRKAITDQIAAIAAEHGATSKVENYMGRVDTLEVDFGDVKMSTDIGDTLSPGVLAHFHDAKRDLRGIGFDSINECHFRKATLWGDDAGRFCAKFERCCKLIRSGEAFAS